MPQPPIIHAQAAASLILEAGPFRLRPIRGTDGPEIHAAAMESFADLQRWFTWCKDGYAVEDATTFAELQERVWNDGMEFSFCLQDAATGRLCGVCGLNEFHRVHPMCNLGYWVRTSARGRGAAALAARTLAEYAFSQLGMKRVEIVAAVPNMGSRRTAEKAGAAREGMLRNRISVHEFLDDAIMYSLTPEDLAGGESHVAREISVPQGTAPSP